MKPKEVYSKFLNKNRQPTTVFLSGSHSLETLRVGLYNLRKRLKENYIISQSGSALTIKDPPSIE